MRAKWIVKLIRIPSLCAWADVEFEIEFHDT